MNTSTDLAPDDTASLVTGPGAEKVLPPPPGWPVLDERAYHGLAGNIVRAIEPHTEADPVGMLVQLVSGFGNIVGADPYLLIGARRHPARLNIVLVGRSSVARKGEGWAQVYALLRRVDDLWAVKSGLSSGEGLIYNVRDSLGEDPGVLDKRLFVIEEEMSQALRMKSREGNTLSTVVRQAWDSGDLRFMVKNNPNTATGAHISIVGHITREELDDVFSRDGGVELCNGFANRFLWIAVRRCREIPSPKPLVAATVTDLVKRLRAAYDHARTIEEVQLDAEAEAAWEHVYSDLTAPQPGSIGKALDRGAPQVKRLALGYTLLDTSPVITRDHLNAALAVWQYATESAVWVFRDQLPPKCHRILNELKKKGVMDESAIYGLFNNHQPAEVREALQLLLYYRLAAPTRVPTGGRPRTVWALTAREEDGQGCEESEESSPGK